jgi:hypothetical protein
MIFSVRKLAMPAVAVIALLGAGWASSGLAAAPVSVTTYHNDNLRTGWNPGEKTLTPANVSGGGFNLIASTLLDDQVDAQPLVVPNQPINGQGTHNVVYVATESNSVYAIDATSGQVLLSTNFGSPVPYYLLPGGCNNNGPNIGINSTPVIDPSSGTMYVITYTLENGNQTFRIHALNLSTLADEVPSVVVTASGTLNNGQTYQFQAAQNRQRPGLLLANGNVYAGFGSFCDIDANVSRGWVLGWQAGTLTPLPANRLNNALASSPDDFFLTSVWMSGYGLASNNSGDIFFVTGNSDYSGTTYNAKTNLSESVVALSSDLTKVKSYFSPGNVSQLEQEDGDFGSGGVLLLATQKGSVHELAVAAGKAGTLYLLNAKNLGEQNNYLNAQSIGSCWCGQSYFEGSDKMGRVVSSGGGNVNIYGVQTKKSGNPSLVWQAGSAGVPDGQFPGFFTSVSSNGKKPNTAVIWAVSRPTDSDPADIYLYAFDQKGNTLYSGLAGTWPNVGGDSNTVPTVANGNVYVASNQTLAIFGLGTNMHAKLPATKVVDMRVPLAPGEHEIHGVVRSMTGNMITVARRDGSLVRIDSTLADKKSRMAQASVGNGLLARGTFDGTGILRAHTILHAVKNPAMWKADR